MAFHIQKGPCVLGCFSQVQFFCDPVDGSPPGSSVSETIWAWLLEWVAMPSSSRSSEPVDRTRVSYVSALEVASLSLMPFAL